MARKLRWDRCIAHRAEEADEFFISYFGQKDREVLLIGGAGFDPRSTALTRRLANLTPALRAILIREQRPNPAQQLLDYAEANIDALCKVLAAVEVVPVEIVRVDNSIVGGRNLVTAVNLLDFRSPTDVVVDISAMSVGVSYPLIRYLIERKERHNETWNIHMVVNQDAALDESILPLPSDTPSIVHGFRGGWGQAATAKAAKLWLPQLALGRQGILQRIYEFVEPHETCPILPFPAARPRLADELAEHYLVSLESSWEVDPRNIVYAAEDDPLDLYRTLLRIDDLRRQVFEESGGSLLVLSPTGSKLLSMGALLAALERDLPVVYLESIGYDFHGKRLGQDATESPEFVHIWLEGDAYPQPRIALKGMEAR